MKASEIDKKFDAGENLLEHFDPEKGQRLNQKVKRINVDFPVWMVGSLEECEAVQEEREFMRAIMKGQTDIDAGRIISLDELEGRLGIAIND